MNLKEYLEHDSQIDYLSKEEFEKILNYILFILIDKFKSDES